MGSDLKLRSKIWNGTINLKLTLNRNDSNEQTTAYHYYLTIPRDSYIQIYLAEILSYFKPYMLVPEWSEDLSQWWIEHDEDVPLKWNYPIGLSHDLICIENEDVWDLKLNYRNYPKEYIIPIEGNKNNSDLDFLQDYWINQLKQACFILHGSVKPIMSLSKDDSLKLWQSIVNHNLTIYSSITAKFIPDARQFRYIPIRLYLPIETNNILQPLINPLDSKTVGDMLQEATPELFMIDDDIYRVAYPIIHGIPVPKDAPLLDIYKLFAYIDGFLHINIIIK